MRRPQSQYIHCTALTLLIAIACVTSALAKTNAQSIQIKGSDTMVNLGQAWAERYIQEHPESFVAVTGGGSGTGIAALISGTSDITATSRSIKDKEIQQAKKNGVEPKEFTVALDGLVVVVNINNPVSKLTVDQIADIFIGKIENWKEVGGKDLPIVILSREVNSGTHVYFREHVLKRGDSKRNEEFSDGALLMSSSQAIADEIAQNENAIGYYGMGYINKTQKFLSIARDNTSPYVDPTVQNVIDNTYYISRPLLMYTNGEPKGLVKDFLSFILSKEGQDIVRDIDFVPVK